MRAPRLPSLAAIWRAGKCARLACLTVTFALTAHVHALDLQKSITQFTHTSWSATEGLPGEVWGIAQTPDWYLWLGTEVGLYRFEGMRFETARGADRLRGVGSLLVSRDGALWIGFTSGGIGRLHEGKLTAFFPRFWHPGRQDYLHRGRCRRLDLDRGTLRLCPFAERRMAVGRRGDGLPRPSSAIACRRSRRNRLGRDGWIRLWPEPGRSSQKHDPHPCQRRHAFLHDWRRCRHDWEHERRIRRERLDRGCHRPAGASRRPGPEKLRSHRSRPGTGRSRFRD